MEIKILEETKNKLIIEIEGEDHTFCNAIKEELNNDKDVKLASYKIPHPLVGEVTMHIEAADPKKALIDAAKRLNKNVEKFGTLFKK